MFDKKIMYHKHVKFKAKPTTYVVMDNIPGLTLGDDKSGGSEPSPQSTKRSPRSPETQQ